MCGVGGKNQDEDARKCVTTTSPAQDGSSAMCSDVYHRWSAKCKVSKEGKVRQRNGLHSGWVRTANSKLEAEAIRTAVVCKETGP